MNIALIGTNDTLDKTKKSGFLLVVELSIALHPYILKVIKPHLDLDLPFRKEEGVALAVGLLASSIQTGNRAFIEFPPREFRVTRVMFSCRACGDTLQSNVFSNRSGRVAL